MPEVAPCDLKVPIFEMTYVFDTGGAVKQWDDSVNDNIIFGYPLHAYCYHKRNNGELARSLVPMTQVCMEIVGSVTQKYNFWFALNFLIFS